MKKAPTPDLSLDTDVLAAIDLFRAATDILTAWGDRADTKIGAARLAKDAIFALLKDDAE